MKYKVEVIINKPREQFFSLFDNTENLFKWQPTLKSFKHISGTPGEAGAKSKLTYDSNGKPFEMVETILSKTAPSEFIATYEAKGVYNKIINQLQDEEGKTKLIIDSEFKFSGPMAFFSLFMKSMFIKQTTSDMNKLKEFAETA